MNFKNTILICNHPSKLKLNQIDSIMRKYKICVIRGIVNPKDLKDPMNKLKIFIKKNKDWPAIGENPKHARGYLMKFISRIRSIKSPGVTTVVKRTIYNPLHKKDKWGFNKYFEKLAQVRNVLMKKHMNYAINKVQDNRWTAARIHHFPRGAGFMFPHKDTLLPKISKLIGKYYQVLMIMTQKGKDFSLGGGTIKYKNKLIEYENFTKVGDIVIYDATTEHGVNTIDPHKAFIQRSGEGRYSGLVTLYKLIN